MKITGKDARQLDRLLAYWQDEKLLDEAQAAQLRGAVEVVAFDWRRLARYLLWTAIGCVAIGVGALIASSLFQPLVEFYRSLPYLARALLIGALSGGLFTLGWQRRHRHPDRIYSNEIPNFFAVLLLAEALRNLLAPLATGDIKGVVVFCLITSLIYLGLATVLESCLVWLFGLLTLGSALGAETSYLSGMGAYFLDMPIPLLFVGLGAALIGLALPMQGGSLARFAPITRVMGLLYLFIALWILSIFGNMQGHQDWHEASHLELAAWSLLFAAAASLALWLGIRHDDALSRGFGLTFLFINLYTRFFEYFWNTLHKGVFFTLLGLSLWYLGSRAEKLWLRGQALEHDHE